VNDVHPPPRRITAPPVMPADSISSQALPFWSKVPYELGLERIAPTSER
jgi:hypothetical protein